MLAHKGYRVTGVDRSDAMIAIAEEKKRQIAGSVKFKRGDIRTVDLHKRLDAAIAIFAVMGYQTTNDALESALRNAAKHLNPGGLLIFDGWFGPAVIAQKPQDKILIIEKGSGSVIRLTRPNLDVISETVDVNFTMLYVEDDVILDRVEETHKMRFFFTKELEFMLAKTGYQAVAMHPFIELGGELTENDWNMAVTARRVPV